MVQLQGTQRGVQVVHLGSTAVTKPKMAKKPEEFSAPQKNSQADAVVRVVIFDFDGTLADVVPLMRKVYGDFAVRKGYPEMTEEIYETLRKGTLKDVLKWAGIKPWQLPGIMREGRSAFYKGSKQVMLFEGITDLLPQLKNQGIDLYILSSNSVDTIKEIMKRNNVDTFVTVLKRPALFGKSVSIKKLMKKNGYKKSEVWMVGDEVRDIEAANKAGVNSVAVAWGLQHEIALERSNPTFLARSVKELNKILLKEANNG